ncbi:hypothetical protein QBC39DRAFT_376994 [Podospora conica]|nr:hypothetical protein QBC39DRAFT_376994 [Schizothecium conicum]
MARNLQTCSVKVPVAQLEAMALEIVTLKENNSSCAKTEALFQEQRSSNQNPAIPTLQWLRAWKRSDSEHRDGVETRDDSEARDDSKRRDCSDCRDCIETRYDAKVRDYSGRRKCSERRGCKLKALLAELEHLASDNIRNMHKINAKMLGRGVGRRAETRSAANGIAQRPIQDWRDGIL